MNKFFKILFSIFFVLLFETSISYSEGTKIKIGVLAPLSGEKAYLGKQILNSIRMALIDIKNNNIEKIFGKCVKLKWPNDLIYESKKIGGILVETENFEEKFLVVLGIGINLKVNPNEPHWGDLDENLNDKEKKLAFVRELAWEVSKLENYSNENWQSDWLANCVHMNSKIKIASSNEELFFHGIDHTGAALLKNTNGEIITYQESSLSVLNLY